MLQALVGLFELPEDESVPDDEHFIEIEDTPGNSLCGTKFIMTVRHLKGLNELINLQ